MSELWFLRLKGLTGSFVWTVILGFMWCIWFLHEKSTTPTPPVQEGSFLSPERAAEAEERAKNYLPALSHQREAGSFRSTGYYYRGSQNQLWKQEGSRVGFMSNALFERSVSLRLTWLFWFFLWQVEHPELVSGTKRPQKAAIEEKLDMIKGC